MKIGDWLSLALAAALIAAVAYYATLEGGVEGSPLQRQGLPR